MAKLTLRQKQVAQAKHLAEQFPLTLKGKPLLDSVKVKPKNVGGRPPTNREEVPIWVGSDFADIIRYMKEECGYSPGTFVEMLITLAKPKDGWKRKAKSN